jgi:NADH:ubiquinone oxidoreductase subunit 6 (subunit J)
VMELLAKIAFAFYALIIAGGAVLAVGAKNLVRALVGLVLTLFGVAGMYLLMSAPVVAFMQILIYVGAVSVLIFIAVMLVRTGPDPRRDVDQKAGGERVGAGGGERFAARPGAARALHPRL